MFLAGTYTKAGKESLGQEFFFFFSGKQTAECVKLSSLIHKLLFEFVDRVLPVRVFPFKGWKPAPVDPTH